MMKYHLCKLTKEATGHPVLVQLNQILQREEVGVWGQEHGSTQLSKTRQFSNLESTVPEGRGGGRVED